ncbi:hypothetical protein TNIN_253751 [Trichonephila inaurata madagascariensis]|uniref:Uncharacterized protein n=1 Tax=Trichonephila inaurata madagascariensis TaxID=2747483 RepID=A0A8X6JDK7_9ARAC|nr:hypothetical protein TNIN_253751 [Trichonephila inaurata madagascariensis]
MYGMVSSHSGARARIKTKSFSPQASTEQPNYSSSKKAPKNFFQRIISFIKDAWYGITEPNGIEIGELKFIMSEMEDSAQGFRLLLEI